MLFVLILLPPTVASGQVQDLYVGSNSSGVSSNFTAGTNFYGDGTVGYTTNAPSVNNTLLVANTNTLLGLSGNLTVGYSGTNNMLVVSNGASLTSASGYLGLTGSSNNTAIVTGVNSLWSNSAELYVGLGGSGHALVISNGGTVADSNGYFGYDSASFGNHALVTGSNSLWTNTSALYVGLSGVSNSLVISNGATVVSTSSIAGDLATSSGNSVLVTGAGSLLSNQASLYVGYEGSSNSLVVSNGGTVSVSNSVLGYTTNSSGNSMVVTGTGSLFTNAGSLSVGLYGASNSMVISNGGTVFASDTTVGAGATASNNKVLISGSNSVLSNSSTFTLANGGDYNTLNISNGGQLIDRYGSIAGSLADSNNVAVVTGKGSLWSNSSSLIVGEVGSGNSLVISNGGTVVDSNGYVDYVARANSNTVIITGTSDGGTRSTWSNSGVLGVGLSGNHNSLLISNGAVAYSQSGLIDAPGGGNNNQVIVTGKNGTNSQWIIAGDLGVGVGGTSNSLILSNGGQVLAGGNISLGSNSPASNNSILVTGAGSMLSNAGTVYVGNGGTGNSMVISNGGNVSNSGSSYLGWQVGASNNSALITGSNSKWSVLYGIGVGVSGSGNTMTISNGAIVSDQYSGVGVGTSASNNSVLVTGHGSMWSNSDSLAIGGGNIHAPFGGGSDNSLVINDGGKVFASRGFIGATNSSNNSVLVTGSASTWNVGSDLMIGVYGSSGNSLVISNGAAVSVSNNAVVGYTTNSSNNSVQVTGTGSRLSNSLGAILGNDGSGNNLVVSNSGVFSSGYSVIGSNSSSSSNSVLVTGAGTRWSNLNTLTVGQAGGGTLTVANSGAVAASSMTIASQAGSSGTLNIGRLGGSDNAGSITASTINFGAGTGTINFNQNNVTTISSTISSGIVESTRVVSEMTTNGIIYRMVLENQETGVGTVAVNQLGKGTTILSGNNSYTGTTTISAGTLQANSRNALGTSTVILNGGTLAVNSLLTISTLYWSTPSSVIAINNPGSNFLKVTGAINLGVTPRNDTNTVFDFSLFNFISTGTAVELLDYGSNNALNASQFAVNNLSDYTLFTSNNALWILVASVTPTNPITPTNNGLIASNTVTTVTGTQTNPNVTFQPSGVLNVTANGNLTITGGVNVTNNGLVILNGTLNTPFVYVASGGTLEGSGLLNGNLTNSGTLSPGNSPGTLTVKGNFTQTGSGELLIQVANGSHDFVNVSGSATLGGTLIVTPYGGHIFQFGEAVPFLSASNVTGSFASVVVPEGYRGRVKVVGDPVMEVLLAPASYTQLAASPNQYRLAQALDSFTLATSGDQLVVSTTLDSLTASQYQQAFNQIAPTFYEQLPTIAFNQANAQNQELVQRLYGLRVAGVGFSMTGISENTPVLMENPGVGDKNPKSDILRPTPDNRWGMFVDGNGIFGTANSANMLPAYNFESGGVTTGLTYKWSDRVGTGLYAGYQGAYAKNNGLGTLIDNAARFGVISTYGAPDGKGLYLDALLGGAYHNYNAQRPIQFGSLSRTASSTPGAGELDSMLAGGYSFRKGNWNFGPVASLQYAYFGVNGFGETGAQSLDLNNQGWNSSSMISSVGANAAYSWQANRNLLVVPQINLSWQHEFLQNPYAINSTVGGSPTFATWSATPNRDTFYTGVGVTLAYKQKWNTSFFYNAAAGNQNLQSQNIFLSLGVTF